MKTSVNVPPHLLGELQLRATQEGRPVQEVIADLLQAGMSSTAPAGIEQHVLVSKNLPLMKVRPVAPAGSPLSAQQWSDWVKHLEMQHELERYETALGHQHVDRAHD